jgi:hypothetical protein
MNGNQLMDDQPTLPFETFWAWLLGHPNCIVRAGTPEAILYDDEDLHWHFAQEEPGTLLVQVLRGKLLVGELLLAPDQVAYVQGLAAEREEEYVFELITETESDRFASYFFVLSHGYDVEGEFTPSRVH